MTIVPRFLRYNHKAGYRILVEDSSIPSITVRARVGIPDRVLLEAVIELLKQLVPGILLPDLDCQFSCMGNNLAGNTDQIINHFSQSFPFAFMTIRKEFLELLEHAARSGGVY